MLSRTIVIAATVSFVAGLSAGCSDDVTTTPGGGGSGAAGVPLDELGPMWAEALCTAYENCLGDVYGLFFRGEDCVATATAQFADQEALLQSLLDAGTASYDGTKVEACLAALSASGCAELAAGAQPACDEVFVGTVDAGGDCNADAECTGDAYCAHDNSCPGRCEAQGTEGASCTRGAACADGLACDGQSCVKPGEEGDACGGGVQPDCRLGLFCLGEDNSNNTPGSCATLAEAFGGSEGMSCDPATGLCDPALSCVVDTIGMGGATFVCAARVSSGAACSVGIPDPCPVGEFCDAPNLMMGDASGTCSALAAAGEPCSNPAVGNVTCAPNLRCDGGTCRARQQVGGSCGEDAVCYAGNCVSSACQLASSCE